MADTTPRLRRPFNLSPEIDDLANAIDELISRLDRKNVKYLHKDFDKANAGQTISLGAIPPDAVIDYAGSGVEVHELFNAGTTNRLDIGTAANTTLYASDLPLGSVGFKPLDEATALHRPSQTEWTELKAVIDVTGSTSAGGKASVIIRYTTPN